jgi:PKD repeat protein
MEEEGEALSEAETSEIPPTPKRGRRFWIVLGVILTVVLFLGGLTAFVLLRNGVPTADFTYTSVDTHLAVTATNSTDPDGDALTYTWNWGDSSGMSSGFSASHDYVAEGMYTVTLTVQDGRGGIAMKPRTLTLTILPNPFFIARQAGTTTTFDASRATGSPGRTLTSYAWTFGDGGSGTGAQTTHTYAIPGRYMANLTVADSGGRTNTASRYVSANTTTVDVMADQFFVAGCPYQNYWSLRFKTYGDVILNDGRPCTDYYPWILYHTTYRTENPSWVYALWRLDIIATHNLGYSVLNPVYLPTFNASVTPAPDSYIRLNLTFNYMNYDYNLSDPLNIRYLDNKTQWLVNQKYSDGYGYLVRGNVTMDLTESKRVFGVRGTTTAEAQSWWYNNTYPGRRSGPLETALSNWLIQMGNGKYYTWNGWQWLYEADITDLNATVASDGTTTIQVFWDGWGYDALFDRMSYWGSQDYSLAVNAPWGAYPPRGWMPFETCWCENATIDATIRNGLDIHYAATSGYWFGAVGNPGLDGILNTSDDLAGWAFSPSLIDYVPRQGSGLLGASTYPDSELRWYETKTTFITSPGSSGYGTQYEYMITPVRWNMSLGNTLTLLMPSFPIPWYDPVRSQWDPANLVGRYVTFNSALALRLVTPAGGYWLWDVRARVFSMAAPSGFRWPDTGAPLNPEPYIEFGPESTG